jgi:Ca2+-binding EF-hand superfamily protein
VYRSLGKDKAASEQDVNNFFRSIDENGDKKIAKDELFKVLKVLINN